MLQNNMQKNMKYPLKKLYNIKLYVKQDLKKKQEVIKYKKKEFYYYGYKRNS